MRPIKLDDIVGQERVKIVCKTLMLSAKKRNEPIPHILFSGSSGTGKTSFARALANDYGGKLHLSNGGTITSIKDVHAITSYLNRGDIWFIDEIHRIPMKVCESLYTIMEDFRYEFMADGKPTSEAIAPFTMIGATTDLGVMPLPMRARFKFISEFQTYTLDELTEISLLVAKSYGFKLNKAVASRIAMTCRDNPRHVVSRTEWVRDFMVANDLKKITTKQLVDIIDLQGFDKDGLRPIDRRYLTILALNGPIGVQSIASKLGVDQTTITTDIEPYLLVKDMINITTKGRTI